jgi:methyl-accepting chemotaxis protein
MRLKTKIYSISLGVPALLASILFIVGSIVIHDIVFKLHTDLLHADISKLIQSVDDKIRVLENSGVATLPKYIEQAQNQIIDEIRHNKFEFKASPFMLNQSGDYHFDKNLDIAIDAFPNVNKLFWEGKGDCELSIGGENFNCTYSKVKEWGWVIGLLKPQREMVIQSTEYQYIVASTALIVLLISLALSYYLARQFSSRVDESLACLTKAEQGDFTARIPISNVQDEMGTLQSGINKMISEVEIRTREQSETEVLLTHAKVDAEEANKAKSIFLANMSHEIRTPLTSIVGFSESLLESGMSMTERAHSISTIIRCGHHLIQIISDILDLSKIEVDKLTVESIPVPLFRLLEEIKPLAEMQANDKGLNFEIDYEFLLPVKIHSDPVRLKQILFNLANNAIKFTNKGFVKIVVRCQPNI